MNALEAGLLERSSGRLTDTLLQRRILEERRREREEAMGQRERESALDRAMRGEELGLRKEELGQRRQEREDAQAALADYRDQMLAAKTDDDKFRVFQNLINSGMATQETLDNVAKAMSAKMGVEVKLIAPKEKPGFETRAGHELKLAEQYRQRSGAAQHEGAGDEAERFRTIAERLERGVGREEDEPMGELSQEVGAVDPITGKGAASVRRKIPLRELEAEIQKMTPQQPGTNAPAAGAPGAGAGQFASEQAARAAGHKAGDIVILLLNGKPTRVRLK